MASVLSDIADGMKRLQKINKDLSEIELREAIVEQRELLLTAREEINSLREEISRLEGDLADEKKKQEQVSKTTEVSGFKYDTVDGAPIGLPYCPTCEVKESGKLYRLKKTNAYYSKCPNCNNSYNVGEGGRVHEDTPAIRIDTGGSFI